MPASAHAHTDNTFLHTVRRHKFAPLTRHMARKRRARRESHVMIAPFHAMSPRILGCDAVCSSLYGARPSVSLTTVHATMRPYTHRSSHGNPPQPSASMCAPLLLGRSHHRRRGPHAPPSYHMPVLHHERNGAAL